MILVLCLVCANCVELENICSSDTFTYNDLVVNAFHKVPQNLTFGPLKLYLINETLKCDEEEFKNKANFRVAIKAKNA